MCKFLSWMHGFVDCLLVFMIPISLVIGGIIGGILMLNDEVRSAFEKGYYSGRDIGERISDDKIIKPKSKMGFRLD